MECITVVKNMGDFIMDKSKRILVLGLDGVDWELLGNWISKGYLPNFKKLLKEGSFGPLESTIPPLTPPAWTSITTGKNPGKHGIYDFFKMERGENGWKQSLCTSLDKKSMELWDYVENSIVVNLPVSYPPRKINGVMITGMLTPSTDTEFTYPPELREVIIKRFPNYRFELNWSRYKGRMQEFIRDLYEMTEERVRLFWYLFEKDWNLMFFVFVGPDRLQHILWEDKEMRDYYRYFDSFIVEILDRIKYEDVDFIIVSDHGFGKVEKIIYINKFLEQEGYLRLRLSGRRKILGKMGITKENLSKVLIKLKLVNVYNKLSPKLVHIIRDAIPGHTSPVYDFDLDTSRAFMVGFGGIYINDSINYNMTKMEIKEKLENLKDPETGERVIERVYEKDEIYFGPFIRKAPDLIILPKEGYTIVQEAKSKSIIEKSEFRKADHRLYGIFFAWGSDIKQNNKIENIKVYDVAPTILHIFGLPIPNDMDGRVLVEAFEPDSEPAMREPVYVDPSYYSKSEEEKLKAKIRNLKIKGKI